MSRPSRKVRTWLGLMASLLGLAGLVGCASQEAVGPVGPAAVFGWRSAGLVMPKADHDGGLHRMIKVGNSLFAMDAYSSDSAPEKRWCQWRVWELRSGTWSQLSIPDNGIPSRWTGVGNDLVIGTMYSGKAWSFNTESRAWKNVSLPDLPDSPDTMWTVRSMGVYSGKIFIGMDVYGSTQHFCWIGDASGGSKYPCIGANKNFVPDNVQELDGYLYAISRQYGIFRWKMGDSTWEQLPSARGKTITAEEEFVSAIGIHHGKLYVGYAGYYDGLYRWNGDGTWTSMTPLPPDGTNRRETPRDIRVITSYRDRLYMAGVAGSSVMYWSPKDSTKPAWGDWRLADDGWCTATEYRCGSQNWGIVGIGDTLYATGWGFVAKSPLADVEKMGRLGYTQ